uniref:Uncharacterized protein n=1 Tax=Eutreptiella gymnastica TaxID=73025 RepID=A0A7S4GBV1_9EUGL
MGQHWARAWGLAGFQTIETAKTIGLGKHCTQSPRPTARRQQPAPTVAIAVVRRRALRGSTLRLWQRSGKEFNAVCAHSSGLEQHLAVQYSATHSPPHGTTL